MHLHLFLVRGAALLACMHALLQDTFLRPFSHFTIQRPQSRAGLIPFPNQSVVMRIPKFSFQATSIDNSS
jgi:hypothetical protein